MSSEIKDRKSSETRATTLPHPSLRGGTTKQSLPKSNRLLSVKAGQAIPLRFIRNDGNTEQATDCRAPLRYARNDVSSGVMAQ